MTMKLSPVVLQDANVRLEPLEERHLPALYALSDDPDFWRWRFREPVAARPAGAWEAWLAQARLGRELGHELPFVVRMPSADAAPIVGTTRFMTFEPAHRRVEIGATFYAAAARGTKCNPACKRLLLAHAFEALGCVRVELKCDARNARSRAAIAKLGAVEEGVLRQHMTLADGFARDSVYFSVLDREWPTVRDRLLARLA